MLVEDDLINQAVARKMLIWLGHTVHVVPNGREALKALECSDDDFVLMDMQMPVMDGLTTTPHIREREVHTGKHLQIVAITANAMSGDRERYYDGGVDDYVSKPITSEKLSEVIDRTLRRTEIRSSPTPTEYRVFDDVAALRQVNGDVEFLRELCDYLLADSP